MTRPAKDHLIARRVVEVNWEALSRLGVTQIGTTLDGSLLMSETDWRVATQAGAIIVQPDREG